MKRRKKAVDTNSTSSQAMLTYLTPYLTPPSGPHMPLFGHKAKVCPATESALIQRIGFQFRWFEVLSMAALASSPASWGYSFTRGTPGRGLTVRRGESSFLAVPACNGTLITSVTTDSSCNKGVRVTSTGDGSAVLVEWCTASARANA